MLWAPSMALLSDGAEALGIAQGFAFALEQRRLVDRADGGCGRQRAAGRRDVRRRPVPAAERRVLRDGRNSRPQHVAARDRAGALVIADAAPRPFWLDHPDAPAARPPLEGAVEADLVVVGGGLTGLWTALQAAEEGKRVVLLEGERIAFGASGRNGGFCSASLTHGIANGLARWPERDGRARADGTREPRRDPGDGRAPRDRLRLGGQRRRSRSRRRRTRSRGCAEGASSCAASAGRPSCWTPKRCGRRSTPRPTSAGSDAPREPSLLDPARLCWGLARAAEAAGASVFEASPVTALRADGAGVRADTAGGSVRARHALLATSAFPPLVRAIRRYVVAVYDYVLVTEPLSPAQRDAIGWRARQGISDMGNLFHYYRQTRRPPDPLGRLRRDLRLPRARGARARPAAGDVRAARRSTSSPPSRSWRGCASRIAGAARSTPAAASPRSGAGRSAGGRRTWSASPGSAWARAASRRASGSSCSTGSTRSARGCEMVRRRPLPFPPEPARWAVIELTRARAGACRRRRGTARAWLRDARPAGPRLRLLSG